MRMHVLDTNATHFTEDKQPMQTQVASVLAGELATSEVFSIAAFTSASEPS
jgi:hypothetical protein